MNFSLKATLDVIEAYAEDDIVAAMLSLYDQPRAVLFCDRFISQTDATIGGFKQLKAILYSIYEINESFLEQCLPELRALISILKGDVGHD